MLEILDDFVGACAGRGGSGASRWQRPCRKGDRVVVSPLTSVHEGMLVAEAGLAEDKDAGAKVVDVSMKQAAEEAAR